MEAANQFRLRGEIGAMIGRMRDHWGLDPMKEYDHLCTRCGRCERECTQKLDIIHRLATLLPAARNHLEGGKPSA
jgi:ferredoxin